MNITVLDIFVMCSFRVDIEIDADVGLCHTHSFDVAQGKLQRCTLHLIGYNYFLIPLQRSAVKV